MDKKMKILIAYDGSECGEAALDDLHRAGLPSLAEVLLISVADVFLPPEIDDPENTSPAYIPDGVKRAHRHAAEVLAGTQALAERAGERLQHSFPLWEVRAEAIADSPAWAVIRTADEWKPDLVIVGAQGHAVLGGRLILGSVSQRVLYESRCSVRIARAPKHDDDSPARIIVGLDGSVDAEAAIDAVVARSWPAGSEVHVLSVLDTFMSVTPDLSEPSAVRWVEVGDEKKWGWVKQMFEPSAEKLRKAGLSASVVLRKGNPKHVLVEEAAEWGADSIFLGAKGMRGIERLLLGSISAAVAAYAKCSVEIVR